MAHDPSLASLAPAVLVHLAFASIALVLGPSRCGRARARTATAASAMRG